MASQCEGCQSVELGLETVTGHFLILKCIVVRKRKESRIQGLCSSSLVISSNASTYNVHLL